MIELKNKQPAILGGDPAVTADHEPASRWPILTAEDEQAVLQVMRDGNISTHPVIRELEQDYKNLTGRKYALAHNNGTAGLLAAFYALGLQPGDEVLVPSATFWASVVPMLWLGAVPVFCESETERMGIDPEDVRKKITDKTRAIMVVHLWGLPGKMTELFQIAKQHKLKIIEDASHAHGATWRGKPCGTLGDISVFSLQGDKLSPGGEGGVFLCDEYEYFEKAACLGDITRIIELETPAQRFAATSFGIKTRIAPVSAAIARSQLRRLRGNNRRRNDNLVYLSHALEKLGFHTFLAPDHVERVYFEFMIRYKPETILLPRDVLIEALRAEGCQVSVPRYPLLHQQPLFTEGAWRSIARLGPEVTPPEYDPNALPGTQSANEALIKLPSFPNADREILDQYIRAFEKVIAGAGDILKQQSSPGV
ncbi:MAG: DegT/DnrJ/EryC1/StrS family aminotransferase [Nitrospinota bacterium]|nr:DegT/DnrJ/EryC1/StrS family aminotransferase [Nitrospinota bacterium]